jgi:hypothetical protein
MLLDGKIGADRYIQLNLAVALQYVYRIPSNSVRALFARLIQPLPK